MIVKDVMREERSKVEGLLFDLWRENPGGWDLDDVPVKNLREIAQVLRRAKTEQTNVRTLRRLNGGESVSKPAK